MEPILQWLEGLGLGQYGEVFVQAAIDPAVLPDLTEADLEKLGVVLGHRKKLMRAIAALSEPGHANPSDTPIPAAEPKATAGAERRQLTVMFCDLVGSTALSARLDPEDLRDVIGRYHTCVAETVSRFGGFVAKYMGDGVLVYFGYPHAHEDDPEQAVRTGLALVEAVGELSRMQVRIGIATGLVVVGDLIGQGSAQEQAIVGETPNLASRLQTLAEPGAIVIADSTRRQIGGLFEVADLGLQSLKGFAGLQCAWRVLSENRGLGRFEALRSGATALVGRNEEMELLLRRWVQAKAGSGRVVLISGEPGVGKSRLAEALAEQIATEPRIRIRYFCSPHHQDSALYPVVAQMERAAGFTHDDAPEAKLAKLQALLGYIQTQSNDKKTVIAGRPLPPGKDPVVDPAIRRSPEMAGSSPAMTGTKDAPPLEDVTLIAELHSLPTSDIAPPLDVTPQRKKEKTFDALLHQIERLSRQQPVLMIFEDIHWIDPSSRELLDRTIEWTANRPLLLLATFRPEFQPPWTGQPHVTMLALARLDRRDTASMVENIAGNAALPSDIVQEIAERTDGVPLFVEELTKAVLESGAQGAAALSSVPLAGLSVPATLHASLMARLDRLGPGAKDVAQTGAAIGREFEHGLLASVADLPERQLQDALDRLTNSGLLFVRGTPPQSVYSFKHALVQDAAYGTLLRGRRQRLHARIATALEDRFPEIVLAQPALLAQHCAESGLGEKAVPYRLKAGQQSLARSAMMEAVAQLRKGLDVLGGLPDGLWRQQQELELLIALGSALSATKGWSAADVSETFGRARALAEQIDRPEYLVPLITGQFAFHLTRAEHRLAVLLGEQLEKIGEARNDVAAQWLGCSCHGITRFLLGEFVAARALLERFHRLSCPANRTIEGLSFDPYSLTLTWFALTLSYLGYIDQGRSRMKEALSEARRLRHAHTLAHVLLFTNWLDWVTGSPMAHVEEVLALTTEHGFPHYIGWALAYRGKSLIDLGHAEDAVALLNQGLAELRATGNVVSTPMLLTWLAEAHAMLGQPAEEQNYLAEAARVVDTTEERVSEAELLHRVPGDLLNAKGDRAAAERNYREALVIAERQGARLLQLRASTSLARLWRELGKHADAKALLAPIYSWFTEGFDVPVLVEAKALLDELGFATQPKSYFLPSTAERE